MQGHASITLANICTETLSFLNFRWSNVFSGPRHTAIFGSVDGTTGETAVEEVRGPRQKAPDAAVEGFLRKHGASRSDLKVSGDFYVLHKTIVPRTARETIEVELAPALEKFSWPKSMRWGQGDDFSWVRPLRRMVCLLDGEVVPIIVGPVMASNKVEGNRVLAPGPFIVSSGIDWQKKLQAHYVEADDKHRIKVIRQGLADAANDLKLTVVDDDGLLNEVNGLVEWPVPLIGKIDENFMSLPQEVRELSMKINQKYFALRDAEGRPAPYFGFVANQEAPDGGAAIVSGNERVLRARLADARHFWDRDLKTPLDRLMPKLETVTFHASIGSQAERSIRIARITSDLVKRLEGNDEQQEQSYWAGWLCKADLVTGMVAEFPELQGIMGGYYAMRTPGNWDGAVVGPAIRTHYQPKGPKDTVPKGLLAVSVALADKIDTLVQFFRIGEVPTGSGDPYALRRSALGVIRIILENDLRLPLRQLLNGDEVLFTFIIERLRVKLRGEGRRFDVLDAVLGAGTDDDLTRVMQRVDAVSVFLAGPDGANLIVAYRRAANILRIEDAKDGPHRGEDLKHLSGGTEETEFADALANVENLTIEDFFAGRYDEAMRTLAQLRAPVDAFFEKVTVNVAEPKIRLNRLRLLALLRDTMNRIADFSRIES